MTSGLAQITRHRAGGMRTCRRITGAPGAAHVHSLDSYTSRAQCAIGVSNPLRFWKQAKGISRGFNPLWGMCELPLAGDSSSGEQIYVLLDGGGEPFILKRAREAKSRPTRTIEVS